MNDETNAENLLNEKDIFDDLDSSEEPNIDTKMDLSTVETMNLPDAPPEEPAVDTKEIPESIREPEIETIGEPQEPKPRGRPKKDTSGDPRERGISQFLPSAERVQVWKRRPNATWGYVGAYHKQDIQDSGSIEVFIKENIVPQFRGGSFAIYHIDKSGKKTFRGLVDVMEPEKKESQLLDIFDKYTQKMAEKDKESSDRVKESRKELLEIMQLSGASGRPIDPMMMMMLMQNMNNSNKPQNESLPMILSELRETIRNQNEHRGMDMLPPLNLPSLDTSSSNNADMMRAMAEAMKPQVTIADMIALMNAGKKPETTFDDILAKATPLIALVAPIITGYLEKSSARNEKMMERMEAMNSKIIDLQVNPPNDLMKTISTIRALKDVSNELGGSAGPDLFTLVGNIFENLPHVMQAAALMKNPQAAKVIDAVPIKQLPSKKEEDEEVKLEVPDNVKTYLKKMESVATEEELLTHIINVFRLLWTTKEWKEYLAPGIGAAIKKDKEESIEFTTNFFDGLLSGELITERLKNRCIKVFGENIDNAFRLFAEAAKAPSARQSIVVPTELATAPEVPTGAMLEAQQEQQDAKPGKGKGKKNAPA